MEAKHFTIETKHHELLHLIIRAMLELVKEARGFYLVYTFIGPGYTKAIFRIGDHNKHHRWDAVQESFRRATGEQITFREPTVTELKTYFKEASI